MYSNNTKRSLIVQLIPKCVFFLFVFFLNNKAIHLIDERLHVPLKTLLYENRWFMNMLMSVTSESRHWSSLAAVCEFAVEVSVTSGLV